MFSYFVKVDKDLNVTVVINYLKYFQLIYFFGIFLKNQFTIIPVCFEGIINIWGDDVQTE